MTTVYAFYFTDQPPKLLRYTFKYFSFYYTLYNQKYIPVAISKPDSTQRPYYYPLDSTPRFDTLQQLIDFIHTPNSHPLK